MVLMVWVGPLGVALGIGAEAAVDGQHGPGDVGGLLGGQEAHGGRDVGGVADPARRDVLRDAVEAGGHVGRDEAGGDGVDRHAAAGDLVGDAASEADEAGLGGGVVRLPGVRPQPGDARDVHDAPEARADHRSQGGAGQAEGRGEVRLQHAVPVLVVELHRQAVGGDAGVVDQREDRPQLGGGVDEALRGVGLGDVGLHGARLDAQLPRGGGRGLRALGAGPERDGDVPPVGG
jgi:hypothetical protein